MAGVSEISVVLVHGGFVDGSGWEDVYKILKKDGYSVSIVQNATISLAAMWQPRNASSQCSCLPFLMDIPMVES